LGFVSDASELVPATVNFGNVYSATEMYNYDNPFGILLHANSAETESATADGTDNLAEAATEYGGYMMYQIFTATGTGTMTCQIGVNNSASASPCNTSLLVTETLTIGTSGTFSGPTSGVVALGRSAEVLRYTSFYCVLTNVTSLTFALAFVRAYH
jgi:hypothetical protein